MDNTYPRLKQLGIKITKNKSKGPPGVNWKDLNSGLKKAKLDVEKYCKLFGAQTAGGNGCYPWDVEAVLERMMSGRLKGSQAVWD